MTIFQAIVSMYIILFFVYTVGYAIYKYWR